MLTVHTLQRHFENGRHEPLLDAVLANGLSLPLPLRVRLSQSSTSAVALGLRRLVELTFGPTSLSRSMLGWLLAEQRPDGSFDGDPVATAIAAAAFARCQADHGMEDPTVARAQEAALHALAMAQRPDGLFDHPDDRTEDDRLLVAAFVMYLLISEERFHASVRIGPLRDWFEAGDVALSRGAAELWEMATLQLPPVRQPVRPLSHVAVDGPANRAAPVGRAGATAMRPGTDDTPQPQRRAARSGSNSKRGTKTRPTPQRTPPPRITDVPADRDAAALPERRLTEAA